ncbi:hypothetical protein MKW92_031199 [Papaver armeniacum]|nr:hypothetical protein MKW92_031199 [Papaver armeniacum]
MAVQVSICALPDRNTATQEVYGVTVDNEEIYTIVTKNASTVPLVERMYNDYMEHFIVGLDVEWKPPFGRHSNRLATIQLCVDGCRCLIFQIINADKIPYSLHTFLRDTRFKFVGVGIQSDVDKLKGDYDLCVNNFADLAYLAADKYGSKQLKNAWVDGIG